MTQAKFSDSSTIERHLRQLEARVARLERQGDKFGDYLTIEEGSGNLIRNGVDVFIIKPKQRQGLDRNGRICVIAAGMGTGNGTPGELGLSAAIAGTSGTTPQTFLRRMTLDETGISFFGKATVAAPTAASVTTLAHVITLLTNYGLVT